MVQLLRWQGRTGPSSCLEVCYPEAILWLNGRSDPFTEIHTQLLMSSHSLDTAQGCTLRGICQMSNECQMQGPLPQMGPVGMVERPLG
jgi:hypothetical protein